MLPLRSNDSQLLQWTDSVNIVTIMYVIAGQLFYGLTSPVNYIPTQIVFIYTYRLFFNLTVYLDKTEPFHCKINHIRMHLVKRKLHHKFHFL